MLGADGKRERWNVSGPHFGGWEIYHVKGLPLDPNRIWASQTSGWFGQVIQRSDDGGKNWEPVGNEFVYASVPGTHQWYDGTPHPWAFARVWHLEPSLHDPEVVYAGVEDEAMFRSDDAGEDWRVVPIKSDSEHYPPDGKLRVYRSRTGGNEWEALTNGLPSATAT